jgi:predicted amidohydrolase
MKIAAAQIKPIANNIHANIEKHLQFIDLAIKQEAKIIAFPEMSLTGYEREMAAELAFEIHDERLTAFKKQAQSNGILIIAGAPVKINSALHIGAFIFLPNGTSAVYTKQFLHDGEEKYFTPNHTYNPLIPFHNEQISLAICADINNQSHAAQAANRKTTVYIAGIFYTPKGISDGYEKLSGYAAKYAMNVLMANFVGSSYGMEAAGKSACWNNQGKLVAKLNDTEEGILTVEI